MTRLAKFVLLLLIFLGLSVQRIAAQEEGDPEAAGTEAAAEQEAEGSPEAEPDAAGAKSPGWPNRAVNSWKGSDAPALPQALADGLGWRSIGPANMGGRITALAVNPKDRGIWWAATASGGLVKTTNDGITFEHQFDRESTVSIGAIAVAPSNPDVLYVGTGESNPRNSVSWGDGVYRSEDGGKTWKHVGLKASFQIGAIAVHPEDPDVVWVGALGRLWGDSEERGLYKSVDGGKTWERRLFVDSKTGVIDIDLHPADPDVLLVATYERQRDLFDTNHPALRYGEGSGLWRSTDGGETFERVTAGLPTCKLGRLGIDFHQKDPNLVYMLVETEKIGGIPENSPYAGLRGENAEVGAKINEVTKDGPAEKAGLKAGDIVVRVDGSTVQSYEGMITAFRQRVAGETSKLEVSRDREALEIEITFARQPEREGREAERAKFPFRAYLSGQRENVQDQQGENGHEYGGLFVSEDGGRSWRRINSLNPRPMYFSEVRVDPSDPDHVYVLGVSLHRSKDGGKTFTNDGGRGVHVDHHALWIDPEDGRHMILGNDGGLYVTRDRMENWDHLNHVAIGQFYHVGVGPRREYMVYGGLQDNGSWGGPSISRTGGIVNADWMNIGGGDGFVCRVDPGDPGLVYFESQNGGMGRRNLRTGERAGIRPPRPERERRGGPGGERAARPNYRFNWRTPFVLSHHNSKIYYAAGNVVFRSLDRGEGLRAISPQISRTDRGAATALAESPQDPDVLWVGADDGGFWMTRDGGDTWIDLFAERPAEKPEDERPNAEGGSGGSERGRAGRGGRRGRGAMLERLRRADADGDGVLERSEVPERMAPFFDRLDQDGDGRVLVSALVEGAEARRPDAAAGDAAKGVEAAAAGTPDRKPAQTEAGAKTDDPVTGVWEGESRGSGEPRPFTLTLRMTEAPAFSGAYSSDFAEGRVLEGRWNAETGRASFLVETDRFELDADAAIAEDTMRGTMSFAGSDFTMEFEARRTSREVPEATSEVAPALPGDAKPLRESMPEPVHVSEIVHSRFDRDRAYVTFDGHRSDYDEPFVFVTEDLGRTWIPLHVGLPASAGSARCIVEDLENEDLLFLGTEFGAWASIDRGRTWTKLRGDLPTVAVHGFALHAGAQEIVAGTHGRSLWIADVSVLRQLDGEIVAKPAHLFRPKDAIIWRTEPSRGRTNRRFVGTNPPSGATIAYHLGAAAGSVEIEIEGPGAQRLRRLEGKTEAGLHRVVWDLRREVRPAPGRGGARRGPRRGPRVEAGVYTVKLLVDGEVFTQPLRVEIDPAHPDPRWIAFEELEEELMAGDEEDAEDEELDLDR